LFSALGAVLGLLHPVAGGVLRTGLKFQNCVNTLNIFFFTIPGIFESPPRIYQSCAEKQFAGSTKCHMRCKANGVYRLMAEHDNNFHVYDTAMSTFKLHRFLVTLAKLREVTVSFVMTVCPSFRQNGTTRLPVYGF
jgi:hypothetical protein